MDFDVGKLHLWMMAAVLLLYFGANVWRMAFGPCRSCHVIAVVAVAMAVVFLSLSTTHGDRYWNVGWLIIGTWFWASFFEMVNPVRSRLQSAGTRRWRILVAISGVYTAICYATMSQYAVLPALIAGAALQAGIVYGFTRSSRCVLMVISLLMIALAKYVLVPEFLVNVPSLTWMLQMFEVVAYGIAVATLIGGTILGCLEASKDPRLSN